MSVLFLTDIKRRKIKKVFSIFLLFIFVVVNFFGFNINTAHAADPWYSGSLAWGYRVKITVNASQVPSTQTNFPIYVNLANLPAGFFSHVKSDGSDIRVTNSSGTELAREVVAISTASSTGELWFKADAVSNGSSYYIYYGNAGASEPVVTDADGSQHVWDDGGGNYYKGVWHLGENANPFFDSTGVNPSTSGTYPSRVVGAIGNAQLFTASLQNYISVPSSTSLNISGNLTISAIINTVNAEQSTSPGIITKDNANVGRGYGLYVSYNDQTKVEADVRIGGVWVNAKSSNIHNGAVHYLTAVYDGSALRLYVDGIDVAHPTASGSITTNSDDLIIGSFSRALSTANFNNMIDETRVSSIARSADWIKTEYNNQSVPATFYSVAAQEAFPVPDAPTGLTPIVGNTQISLSWTVPADGNSAIDDYVIDFKLTSTSTWTTFADGVSTSTFTTVSSVGLINGSSYDFRVSAVNVVGQGAASGIVTVTPATIPGAPTFVVATFGNAQATISFGAPSISWYDSNWGYRVKITVNEPQVPSTQTNFPVYVDLSNMPAGFFSHVKPDGSDIRITNSTGTTTLAREVVVISTASSTGELWFKADAVSNGSSYYIYYGNAGVSEPIASSAYGSQSVWNDGGNNYFRGVWHLPDGTSFSANDSTSNGRNGTLSSTPPAATQGQMGGGGVFDGANTYIDNTTAQVSSGAFTYSIWVKKNTIPNANERIFGQGTVAGGFWLFMGIGTDGKYVLSLNGGTLGTGSASTNGWDYIVLTSDKKFYLNGNNTYTAVSSVAYTSSQIRIGSSPSSGASTFFKGSLDEARISSVVRSADWITTEYNNQSSPSGFYRVAGEEAVISPDTNNGGSVITSYTVTSSPAGPTFSSSTSPIIVTGLTNGTAYTFTVTATNAMGTGPASVASDPVTPATVPGVPIAILATPGNAQVSLSWTAPVYNGDSGITDYIIEYKLTSAPDEPASWQISADPETPIIIATLVTGLINGTSYDFRISAKNDMGVGNPSAPLVSSTPRTVPSKPTITGAVSGDMQVIVNFTAPDNGGAEITGYAVISNDGGTDSNSGSTNLSHIVTGLTNGTAYTFTVTATNVAGPGPASDPSDPVTPAKVPDVPTLLIATPGDAQVGLSWTEPANNGADITNYVIEYKLHTDSSWTQFGHAPSPAISIIVAGVGLVNGSLYDFRVSAVNIAGTSEVSTPPVSSTPRTVPGVPTIASVERGNGQVTVNFTTPDNGGAEITGYTVTSDPQGIIQTGTASPIIISGLTNGTPYTFTVKATNVAGDGPVSTSSNPVTPATVPGKATSVVAVAGNGQATITFTEPLSTGGSAITGYVVTSNDGGTDSNAGSTNLSHIVTGLTNGSTYTFTVVATNNVGPSLASDASNSIILPTAPTTPLNLAAVVRSSSIYLTWSDSASTGGSAITDYVVEYQLTTGGNWVPFDDGSSVDRFTTVTGLANGTSYDFRVSAKNIIGQSEASNSVSATPGEPAQVFIQGFPDLTNSSIGTTIRITNEGLIEYEYQYTWCVTDAVDNLCGGGNDVFSASNAKSIASHENFDFTATSTVPTPGDYFFHIKVLYGSQSSSAFQSFTAVATFPDPPTSVSAVAGNAQVTVSFTAPSSNGGSAITGYIVTSNPGGLTGTGLTTPIIVTGLTNGTAYSFTMTASNIIGTGLSSSPPSNSVAPGTVPGAINSFSASAGNTQVGLFWSAPASYGGSAIIDYVIEYKLSSDSIWAVFADAISTETTITVTGLTNNLSYDFRVSAVNVIGQGPVNSTSATSVTPPPTNTGGGSSGHYIYPPITVPPNTPTTTPNIEIVLPTTPNIVSATRVPKASSPTTPGTKPIKNEVSTTPTETSHITPPVKQTPADNSGNKETSGVPWVWVITSSVFVFVTGFIIFILRRRRMDDQKN